LNNQPCACEFHQSKVLIGRGSECDLVLPLLSVSRRHAAIQREDDGWMLWDLQSSNGTFVNRRRIAGQRLRPGDEIMLSLPERSPVVLEFYPTSPQGLAQSRVVFDERPKDDFVHASVDFEALQQAPAANSGLAAASTRPPAAVGTVDETAMSRYLAFSAFAPQRRQASLVLLFKQIGEILLTSTALEDMLRKVLDLAVEQLDAQRGCICLCDAKAEEFSLTVAETSRSTVAAPLVVSRSIVREAVCARQSLLVSDARADARFADAQSVLAMDIWSAMCAPLQHAGQVRGVVYVDRQTPEHPFGMADLELLTALGGLAAVGVEQFHLQQEYTHEKAIRARLSRYSSPNVVEQIVAGVDRQGEMAASEQEVTVLFGDLSNFTPLAESMAPAAVAQLLNGTFERLTHAVFLYDGTLDKYLGDGLMAIFGAPLAQPDHAERAVLAALLMQRRLQEFCQSNPDLPCLHMRIGINTGRAVAGDIGSATRKDYTVVGDAINLASRLQSSVAEPGQVVIGQTTYELIKDRFLCTALAEVRVKGKQQMVQAYRVERAAGAASS
jgi:adenylate cyclase